MNENHSLVEVLGAVAIVGGLMWGSVSIIQFAHEGALERASIKTETKQQKLVSYVRCLKGVDEASVAAQLCIRKTGGLSIDCELSLEAIEAEYDKRCPVPEL